MASGPAEHASPWSVACTQCGAPASVSLAHPDEVRCVHCGDVSAPSAELAMWLAAGAEGLAMVEDSQRRLELARIQAMQGSDVGLLLFAGGLVLMLLFSPVFCGMGVVGLLFNGGVEMVTGCTWANMLMSLVVLVPLGWRRLQRRRRELLASCAAEPPLVEGAPSRCRLCGGDLPAPGDDGLTTCAFCGSDSLVSAEAVAARATAVHSTHQDLALEVRARARLSDPRMGITTLGIVLATMWTVHSALVLPTLLLVVGVLRLLHGAP